MRPLAYPLFALLALITCSAVPARADDETVSPATHKERMDFAQDFASAVITILHDPKKEYGARKDILRRAFADSVDIEWIARFVIGRTWRDATDEQREQYTKLYRRFLTETYVTSFAEKPERSIYSIKIMAVSDEEKEAFTVHTQMVLMNQMNLKVDYRVSDKAGTYKVTDIVIENVSLINSHRAEFGALASNSGIDGVIHKLQALLDSGKTEMTVSMK